MKSIWVELNALYVGPECTCGALIKFIQDQQLFQFLSGLNKTYATVKRNTLIMTPLPSISKVYALPQQDKSQREAQDGILNFSSDSASFTSTTFAPTSNSRPYNQKVSFNSNKNHHGSMICKYCKKTGHSFKTCYRLHSFPTDFKFKKNKKSIAPCVQMMESSIPNFSSGIGPTSNSSFFLRRIFQWF